MVASTELEMKRHQEIGRRHLNLSKETVRSLRVKASLRTGTAAATLTVNEACKTIYPVWSDGQPCKDFSAGLEPCNSQGHTIVCGGFTQQPNLLTVIHC